jgi:putative tricarboxylic transport membrane protein
MQERDTSTSEGSLVSNRAMEIVVALMLLAGSAIVITDSARLGFRWQEGEGPAPGYFPFYIALGLAAASIANLVKAATATGASGSFVSRTSLSRVLAVLAPSIAYVFAMNWLGLYVSSALFITIFMLTIGREASVRAVLVGVAVPLFFFFMFEKWFLVPLPKGPLEAMLGF